MGALWLAAKINPWTPQLYRRFCLAISMVRRRLYWRGDRGTDRGADTAQRENLTLENEWQGWENHKLRRQTQPVNLYAPSARFIRSHYFGRLFNPAYFGVAHRIGCEPKCAYI